MFLSVLRIREMERSLSLHTCILLILSKRVSYYRKDLTYDEAIELGKRAIMHATHRDAMSGGINNGANSRILIHINP